MIIFMMMESLFVSHAIILGFSNFIQFFIVFSLTCDGPGADECETCDANDNREFYSTNSSCPCKTGFIDKLLPTCAACHSSWFNLKIKN